MYPPGSVLSVENIIHPLGPEPVKVHIEVSGRRKNLGITHPSQPFIALWTISRHGEEISALPPGDVFINCIDELVRCFQFTDKWFTGMNNLANQVGLFRFMT